MKDLKITKGEWKATQTEKVDSHLDIAINANDYCVAWVYSDSSITNKGDECIANAQLIADAGTTANKCGMLPSELLERYNEAIEVLKNVKRLEVLIRYSKNVTISHEGEAKALHEMLNRVEQTISKAKP